MAYRSGDRQQMSLLLQSIEEYVAEDDPVRAYDAFIKVIVPSQRQALHEAESPFSKSHCIYDKEQD